VSTSSFTVTDGRCENESTRTHLFSAVLGMPYAETKCHESQSDGQEDRAMASRGRKNDADRKSRSGSETRQQNATLQMRMHEDVRDAVEESARRQGFKDAKALVLHRLQPDIALVRPDLSDGA
jgi:hypothetical protein